jgi:hypothetical protein
MYKLGYIGTVPISLIIISESARLEEKRVDHTRIFNFSRRVTFSYIFRPENTFFFFFSISISNQTLHSIS